MELIESAGAGQRSAPDASADFETWVRPHWETMRRIAWRLAGESAGDDVLQNALLAAWRHRGRYDPAHGTPRAWLATITVNEARRLRRSARHELSLVDAPDETPAAANLDLRRAVTRLPRRQRLAVELHYYVGLPVADVAQAMGCAEGTVKSTLAAARDRLRGLLGEDER